MSQRDELAPKRQLQAQCAADFRALVAQYPELCTSESLTRFNDYIHLQIGTQGGIMPRKGYHALGEELVVMSTRLPKSIADRVTVHVETLRAAVPWMKLGPSDALRDLVMRGLHSLTPQALPVPTMQGPPQAAHSAPPSTTPAPPVPQADAPERTPEPHAVPEEAVEETRQTETSLDAPETQGEDTTRQTIILQVEPEIGLQEHATSTPVPQIDAVQPLDTALPRGLGPGDELPPHIRAIADARAHYDKLTLTEFAQLLFDRGIYRTQAKDGTEIPVHRGTLQRWLDRARQAGCL